MWFGEVCLGRLDQWFQWGLRWSSVAQHDLHERVELTLYQRMHGYSQVDIQSTDLRYGTIPSVWA
jgi:hypothetical protein